MVLKDEIYVIINSEDGYEVDDDKFDILLIIANNGRYRYIIRKYSRVWCCERFLRYSDYVGCNDIVIMSVLIV